MNSAYGAFLVLAGLTTMRLSDRLHHPWDWTIGLVGVAAVFGGILLMGKQAQAARNAARKDPDSAS